MSLKYEPASEPLHISEPHTRTGYSFDHVPKMVVNWNEAVVADELHRFTFDRPDLQSLQPDRVPTTGGVDVTVTGENFGALEEFLDVFRQVQPPLNPAFPLSKYHFLFHFQNITSIPSDRRLGSRRSRQS